LLERVVGPVFNHIANTFVDAFVRRAEQRSG
jgi:ribosome-associated toxin RatA of RatAB toxin-antitoxin module